MVVCQIIFATVLVQCKLFLRLKKQSNSLLKLSFFITVIIFFFKIGREVFACRDSVAAFNMSYFAKFLLDGPDAERAVDWIFTNNMRKPPGFYSFFHSLFYFSEIFYFVRKYPFSSGKLSTFILSMFSTY